MKTDERKPEFSLLFLIVSQKLNQKAQNLFSLAHIPLYDTVYAKGTAPSEIADVLGFGSIDKAVTLTMLPKFLADNFLLKLRDNLYLGTPNTGVAFTVPLNGLNTSAMSAMKAAESQVNETRKEGENMEVNYTMIMAFVNQGYSDAVMDAAKPAGAGGGTVFHSRQVGSEEALKFFGISVQEEREIVLILAEKDKKLDIMKAIGEKCGSNTPAHGMIISVPVDNVVGLRGTN